MQSSLNTGYIPPEASEASLTNMKSIPEEPVQMDHIGAPEFCAGH